MSRTLHRFVIPASAAACVNVGGCAGPIALDRAVIDYDITTTDSVSRQLLLNVARARHSEPMHFTAISSIAATYKFTLNVGVGQPRPVTAAACWWTVPAETVTLETLPRPTRTTR